MSRVVRAFFRGKGRRRPELDVGIHEVERLRHDADDRVVHAVNSQLLTDRRVLAAEKLLPEPVTQDDLTIPADFAFVLVEGTPSQWRRPEHPEERRPDGHAGDALRIGFSTDGLTVQAKQGKLFEYVRLAEPIVVVGHSGRGALDARARVSVVERDKPVRLGDRQRAEQHAINDREDRCVRADADAKRQNHGGRESPILREDPYGESQILKQPVHQSFLRKSGWSRSGFVRGNVSRLDRRVP